MKPETADTIRKIWNVVKQVIEIIIIAIAGGTLIN